MEKSLVKQSMLSYLVGGCATPLKNMTSSVGMMQSFPTEWKKHVPNHQPDIVLSYHQAYDGHPYGAP